MKATIIAYYLPQFHPTPENDLWWGKGFTEWTNVGKAKPLFKGHYQPRVPADLGYYDLRLPEVIKSQTELAKEAGVSAFCYWHYWFGNGKQLLEKPLSIFLENKDIDFKFCLAWANHSWERKRWNADANKLSRTLLIKQEYLGIEDYVDHFNTMLPAFKDSRYLRMKDRLVFVIYDIKNIPNVEEFLVTWQKLALKNKLPGFYFIAHCTDNNDVVNSQVKMCDGINLNLLYNAFSSKTMKVKQILSHILRRPLNVRQYSSIINKLNNSLFKQENIYPTIYPNWDASPRLGAISTIISNSTPSLFFKHVCSILALIKDKAEDDRLIFLKSWNEWAEGNYMEPDIKWGKQYIEVLNKAVNSK